MGASAVPESSALADTASLTAPSVLMVLDSTFPPPTGGGSEGQVLTLGRQLMARGVHVVVVTGQGDERQPVKERIEGMDVVRIPFPKVRRLGGALMLLRLLIWLLRNGRRNVAIHAHIASGMAAVACVAGRLIRRPVVVKLAGGFEFDTGMFAPGRRGVDALVLRWAIRQATFYQAISERLGAHLVSRGFDPDRVRLIPNAIDLARFQPAGHAAEDRGARTVQADLVAVFVGRLVAEKALEPFLVAWARVFDSAASVALLIVGSGELEPRLRETVDRLGRTHQIQLLGAHRDVRPFLWEADFAVLPSISEGLSNSLLEYMAAGLPVLGSRISGTEDVVTPGETGWLFEAGETGEMEARLREIAALPLSTLRAMGRRAREKVERHSGGLAITASLLELYGIGQRE
jgi:glycosyltransferase involved in cell wall biosynthesis